MVKKWSGLLITLVLGSVLVFLTLSGALRVVVSDSMAPTMHAGDVILLKPASWETIQPGTIITYQIDKRPITHRVVGLRDGSFVTRGDNNNTDDPWLVPASKVIGLPILIIPQLGYLLYFIREPLGMILLIYLPCALLLIYEVLSIIQKTQAARSPRSKPGSSNE